jgi:hypothetical protein
MHCLNPPLASKPAKGYSWTCAPCSRKDESAAASGLPLSRTAALDAYAAISSSSTPATPSEQSANAAFFAEVYPEASYRGGSIARGRGRGRGGRARGRGTAVPPGIARSVSSLLPSDNLDSDQSRESSPTPFLSLTQRTVDDERGTRCFNRWPYRYFGECVLATDILDPHDSIYPRAVARLGFKYQASPISWQEQLSLGVGVRAMREIEPSDGTLTPVSEEAIKVKRAVGRPKKKRDDTPNGTPDIATVALPVVEQISLIKVVTDKELERGTDDTVEAIYLPGKVKEKKVDKYIGVCKAQLPHLANKIGFLDRALKLLMQNDGDAGRALSALTASSDEELLVDIWTNREIRQFDQTVNDYNCDLRFLKKELPTKKAAQLVRYFAVWKCKKIAEQLEEEKRLVQAGTGPMEGLMSNDRNNDQGTRAVSPSMSIMEGDDKQQGWNNQQLPNKSCKLCATGVSPVWYKGPVSWVNRRLCVNCGLYWRKYATEMPSSHPEMISTRKRDAAIMEEASLGVAPPVKAAKMARSESNKGSSPAHSGPLFEPTKCVLCKKMEPKKRLQQCRQCSLSVHQGCYGMVDAELRSDSWLCEACSNERTLDAALTPLCILCPRSKSIPQNGSMDSSAAAVLASQAIVSERLLERARKSTSIPPPSSSFLPLGALDAVKPTECNNWTHLQCALFMPEVVFTEPERLRIVEGAGSLPFWRYEAQCDLCNQQQGACVTCADSSCKRTFHISCASQQSSFTMGIDLSPVKVTRRDTVVTTTFKGETGHMTAVIYCNAHKETAKSRKLLDMAEVDSSTGLTATQVYANTHKAVKALGGSLYDVNSYPLLRRAKRFDAVVSSVLSSTTALPNGRDSTTPLKQEFLLNDSKSNIVKQPDQKHCSRCKTMFSPFWWDLHLNVQEAEQEADISWIIKARINEAKPLLCVRCRHSVLPRLVL